MKPEISNTIAICILAILLTILAYRVRTLETIYITTPSGSNGASSE